MASLLNTSVCPEAESKLYRLIVENIANLDVDIKISIRKGTHLVKQAGHLSDIQKKIESKEIYGLRMHLRNKDEKEIKVELMLKSFINMIDEKLAYMNKGGKKSIQKFSEFFMSLCCDKILNVSQSNFI